MTTTQNSSTNNLNYFQASLIKDLRENKQELKTKSSSVEAERKNSVKEAEAEAKKKIQEIKNALAIAVREINDTHKKQQARLKSGYTTNKKTVKRKAHTQIKEAKRIIKHEAIEGRARAMTLTLAS